MTWRWKYFSPEEVLSPDGLYMYKHRNTIKLQGFALDNLESLREYVSNPIMCNHAGLKRRGWRSHKENKAIKGVPNSPHVQGIAFDLSCYDTGLVRFLELVIAHTKREIDNNIGNLHRGVRGLGIYPSKNFLHVDYRTLPAKYENYMVVWNGDNRYSTLVSDSTMSLQTKDIMLYLQKMLKLPNNWR